MKYPCLRGIAYKTAYRKESTTRELTLNPHIQPREQSRQESLVSPKYTTEELQMAQAKSRKKFDVVIHCQSVIGPVLS